MELQITFTFLFLICLVLCSKTRISLSFLFASKSGVLSASWVGNTRLERNIHFYLLLAMKYL